MVKIGTLPSPRRIVTPRTGRTARSPSRRRRVLEQACRPCKTAGQGVGCRAVSGRGAQTKVPHMCQIFLTVKKRVFYGRYYTSALNLPSHFPQLHNLSFALTTTENRQSALLGSPVELASNRSIRSLSVLSTGRLIP